MGRPIVTTVTLAAAVSNGIAQSQSLPGASGLSLVLNGSLVSGGVAKMDAARRVIITSAGNDTGITWTVVGTDRNSSKLTETFAGANTGLSVQSTQDFLTVTSITASAATASTVTAGTNGVGSGPWVPWDQFQTDFEVSVVGQVLSGTPTWQLDYTYDDVFGTWLPSNLKFPRALTSQVLANMNGTGETALTSPVRASRLTLTAVGSVQMTSTQQGM